MGIGIIGTNRGDFTFQSADDVIKFMRTAAQENNDIWISGEAVLFVISEIQE